MKHCTAVQEGCGYKDTLSAHRYFAPLAKYFTVCITYQPPLVEKYGNSISKPDINFRILKPGEGRPVQLSCRSELFSGLLQNVYYNQLLVPHPFLYPLYSAAYTKIFPSCLNTFPLFRH